jgi:type III pantothenate kinase
LWNISFFAGKVNALMGGISLLTARKKTLTLVREKMKQEHSGKAIVLAVDVGNTDTVLGIFRRRKLVAKQRVSTSVMMTENQCRLVLKRLFGRRSTRRGELSGVVISSVVPGVTRIVKTVTIKHYRLAPLAVSASLDTGLTIKYRPPDSLGADRLCNAVAAYTKYGGPCIIIDLGTATTFDVVSGHGEYLGGAIAPGIETAASELSRRARLLPKVRLQFPKNVIGADTVGSMQSGILYGALDSMEGMVRRIRKVIGRQSTVIATGGLSGLIARKSGLIDHIEPNLVLQGSMFIYERVRGTGA